MKAFTKRETILRALASTSVPAFWFLLCAVPTFTNTPTWFWSIFTIAITFPSFYHQMTWKNIIITYSCFLILWFGTEFWYWSAFMMGLYTIDSISRLFEYSHFYKVLSTNPRKELRVAAYLQSSQCSRMVAIQLARLIGSDKTERYYKKQGYKWYDIIPDGLFQKLSSGLIYFY